jgi:hypothetical protein
MQGVSAVFFRYTLNFECQTLIKYHKTNPGVNHISFFFTAKKDAADFFMGKKDGLVYNPDE